jgi:hypothetical protein
LLPAFTGRERVGLVRLGSAAAAFPPPTLGEGARAFEEDGDLRDAERCRAARLLSPPAATAGPAYFSTTVGSAAIGGGADFSLSLPASVRLDVLDGERLCPARLWSMLAAVVGRARISTAVRFLTPAGAERWLILPTPEVAPPGSAFGSFGALTPGSGTEIPTFARVAEAAP